MSAQDLHDLMLVYVAGCADADECRRVEIWLASGDGTAHAAYAEAMTVVHAVPLAIESIDPPAHLRGRLISRCDGTAGKVPAITTHGATHNIFRWPLYGMTAIAACLAVALGLSMFRHDADASHWQNVQRVMASPDVNFARMDVVPVSAGGTQSARGAYGRVLYCPNTKQYEVHVFDLAPPPPGRVYELWLITSDKKPLPAGTFNVKANRGMIMATLPPGTNVIMAAITDEPDGGSATPTGKMQLTGALAG